MDVAVRLFGAEAVAAGRRSVPLQVAEEMVTVAELRSRLGAAVPEIAATLASCRIAVNQEFVDDEHKVEPGDEVAVIGMVSGG